VARAVVGDPGAAASESSSSAPEAAPQDTPVTVAQDRRTGSIPKGLSEIVTELPDQPVAAAGIDVNEPLRYLTDDIAMSLRYYRSIFPGRQIGRATFFGGESLNRGVAQHIAKTLHVPAQIADPLARVGRTGQEAIQGVDLSEPQPGWTVAFGLSMCPTDL
jgi:Tfp pilus assembly PilM family ATPase